MDGLVFYNVTPGTLKAYGWVKASWTHGGVSYEIQAYIYPKSDSIGFLEPTQDVVVFGGLEDQAYPLRYIGVFKNGSQTEAIRGECGLMVVPGIIFGVDANLATVKFLIGNKAVSL